MSGERPLIERPSITVEADLWNSTWITAKAFRLVDKTKLPLNAEVKAGGSIEITFIIELIAGIGATSFASRFGGTMGHEFAKDFYGYLKKRIKAVEERQKKKPDTRQKVRILRHSREWDEVIEEYDRGQYDETRKALRDDLDKLEAFREKKGPNA